MAFILEDAFHTKHKGDFDKNHFAPVKKRTVSKIYRDFQMVFSGTQEVYDKLLRLRPILVSPVLDNSLIEQSNASGRWHTGNNKT